MPGPMGMKRSIDKAKDFKGTIKKLLNYLGRYKFAVLIVMIFAALSTIFSIVGPKILAEATNELVAGIMAMTKGTGSINFTRIGQILFFMLILYGISAIFSYIQHYVMTGVSMKTTYRLRKDISEKIHRMPLKYFEGTSQGEVLSRVTNDVDTINQSLNQSITQIITSVTMLIGVVVMMASINWSMTGVTVLIVPVSMVLSLLVVKSSQKYFVQQQSYLGHVNGHIEETYGGHRVVTAFRAQNDKIQTFEGLNETLSRAAWKSQFLSGLIMPAVSFIGNIGYVAVCVLGAYLAGIGTIGIGEIQAFLQYVRSFNQPIAQVANISNVLQQTAAAAERVFEFLGESEETSDDARPVVVTGKAGAFVLCFDGKEVPFKGEIVFENVSFGYDSQRTIINNFSASIKPGQKIAIVGPTGAGKTTIIKLLMRFYDVNSGKITIDGHDLRRFTREDLRKLFGMVLQDTWLYNDTVANNIRYGSLEASDEQVKDAAKAARINHFIKTLQNGYNEEINEESTNISQGQKQLMTIARAILKDPEILILDEATSSVDTKTEIDIKKAMDVLMSDRTSFVIAHRLSTIRDCDLILYMQNGDIQEQGSHDELIARGGKYADLYNSQFDQVS